MLKPGDAAPDFTLQDGTGQSRSLRALREQGPVVIFFYPRDESPICTREVCAFRDAYQDFLDAGAGVVGISSDSEKSHAAFSTHHSLPYPLLADPPAGVERLAQFLGEPFNRAAAAAAIRPQLQRQKA